MPQNHPLMSHLVFLLLAGSSFSPLALSDDAQTSTNVVSIEVSILVTDPDTDQKTSKIEDRFRLTTLEDNEAMVQLGQQVSVITGKQSIGVRATASRMEYQQTGTVVQAEPRVTDAGIVVKLTIEKSWLEFSESEPENEDEALRIRRPSSYTTQLQTTLLIRSGQAETITARVSGGDGSREATIRVSASTGEDRASHVAGRADPHRSSTEPSRPSQADARNRAESESSNAGRAVISSRNRSRGSARPDSDRENDTGDPAHQTAQRLLEQFDSNRDGELDGEERVRLERMLNILGFAPSDRVTVETLEQKFRDRIGQRRTRTSPAESDRQTEQHQQDGAIDRDRSQPESEPADKAQ